jgi:hypothetical protein
MSVIEGVVAAAGGHRKVRSKVDAAPIRTLILTFLCVLIGKIPAFAARARVAGYIV